MQGTALAWIASYLAHSPEAQRQLRHYRVLADEELENGVAKKQNAKNKIKLRGTWSQGGICATILPNVGKSWSETGSARSVADDQARRSGFESRGRASG